MSFAFSELYMTWSKEGHELEDALRRSWLALDGNDARQSRVRSVERALHTIEVPYEEWEVLFRKLLLLDRRLAGHNGEIDRKPRARAARR